MLKNKFYNALKESLHWRREWSSDMEIYLKIKELRETARGLTIRKSLLTFLYDRIVNLPLNTLNFIIKMKHHFHYQRIQNEIYLIDKEMEKYSEDQIKNGEVKNEENKKK